MNKMLTPSNEIKKAPSVHMRGILDKKNQDYFLAPHPPWSANLGDAKGSPAKHQGYKKRLMMGFLDVHQSLLKYVNEATYVGSV